MTVQRLVVSFAFALYFSSFRLEISDVQRFNPFTSLPNTSYSKQLLLSVLFIELLPEHATRGLLIQLLFLNGSLLNLFLKYVSFVISPIDLFFFVMDFLLFYV